MYIFVALGDRRPSYRRININVINCVFGMNKVSRRNVWVRGLAEESKCLLVIFGTCI